MKIELGPNIGRGSCSFVGDKIVGWVESLTGNEGLLFFESQNLESIGISADVELHITSSVVVLERNSISAASTTGTAVEGKTGAGASITKGTVARFAVGLIGSPQSVRCWAVVKSRASIIRRFFNLEIGGDREKV